MSAESADMGISHIYLGAEPPDPHGAVGTVGVPPPASWPGAGGEASRALGDAVAGTRLPSGSPMELLFPLFPAAQPGGGGLRGLCERMHVD
jgi:hypothetical protein